jgi:hypothetical protein
MPLSQSDHRRIRVRIESGPAAPPAGADAPTAFWASISPPRPAADPDAPEAIRRETAELASRVQRGFGKELHAALATYLAQGSPGDPSRPSGPALFFFAVDPPDRWEYSSLRMGVTVFGVQALLASFDDDVDLLAAVLHSLAPDALRRATRMEADFDTAVEIDELRDAVAERLEARGQATRAAPANASRASGADGAADKKGRSLSELLQRTPVVLTLIAALIVGYVAGGTRQEERRRWAETEAKVFEQQNVMLAACTSDKNQAAVLCKDEKQQIANSHLELIRAYKERDDACRAASQAPAARPVAASSAAPVTPLR